MSSERRQQRLSTSENSPHDPFQSSIRPSKSDQLRVLNEEFDASSRLADIAGSFHHTIGHVTEERVEEFEQGFRRARTTGLLHTAARIAQIVNWLDGAGERETFAYSHGITRYDPNSKPSIPAFVGWTLRHVDPPLDADTLSFLTEVTEFIYSQSWASQPDDLLHGWQPSEASLVRQMRDHGDGRDPFEEMERLLARGETGNEFATVSRSLPAPHFGSADERVWVQKLLVVHSDNAPPRYIEVGSARDETAVVIVRDELDPPSDAAVSDEADHL